jgi:hypothetical protein
MKKGKVQMLCTWAINCFPRALKNRFLALAKTQGLSGNMLLQSVIARVLRDEYEKTKKDVLSNEK